MEVQNVTIPFGLLSACNKLISKPFATVVLCGVLFLVLGCSQLLLQAGKGEKCPKLEWNEEHPSPDPNWQSCLGRGARGRSRTPLPITCTHHQCFSGLSHLLGDSVNTSLGKHTQLCYYWQITNVKSYLRWCHGILKVILEWGLSALKVTQ